MPKAKEVKKAANFLFEVGTMRKIARAHRQSLLTDDLSDNISSHSYRVTWIGWILAQMEGADPYKVMLMCLSHDTGEARSGDQNWVHKKYVKVFEEEIIKDQTKDMPGETELKNTIEEYQKRESKEAIIAKDADLLDQILLLKEYVQTGNNEAVTWLKNDGNHKNKHFELLKTASAKKLGKEIYNQKPSDWWKNLWTEKRR